VFGNPDVDESAGYLLSRTKKLGFYVSINVMADGHVAIYSKTDVNFTVIYHKGYSNVTVKG
jgi:hypothetical protein